MDVNCFLLTYPFHTTGLFLYPLKTGFLMFSGGIKREDYHEMDYYFSHHCPILYPQKTFGFLTFSEGIEVGPWREKDLYQYSTKKFLEISAENNS